MGSRPKFRQLSDLVIGLFIENGQILPTKAQRNPHQDELIEPHKKKLEF